MLVKTLALAPGSRSWVDSTGTSLALELSVLLLQRTASTIAYGGFQNHFKFLKRICFLVFLHPVVFQLERDLNH